MGLFIDPRFRLQQQVIDRIGSGIPLLAEVALALNAMEEQ